MRLAWSYPKHLLLYQLVGIEVKTLLRNTFYYV